MKRAAEIYTSKVPEQKRIIITELFEKLVSNGDALSVTYTKFTNAIAKKTAETVQFLEGQKMANRTFEKALTTSVSEGNSGLINQLRPIWQEWAEGFQTLDDLQSIDLTPEDELRIKRLLSSENADEEESC